MPVIRELAECRVLIVDDVKANVDMLVEALRGDYKLSVALDGEAALRAVEKAAPDLLLLDIVMPGIDGYEVCRRLRADPATREIPIMFLSSLEDVQDKARGFELGANDYLTKPFEILEVKARVRSLLKAKAYADAIRAAQERDLAIAREIQMGILPSDLASPSRGLGLDVHATIEPARHVGGDLFEVLRVSDDRLVVAVGDVCGKGIPAALFMAVTVTLLRTLARQLEGPRRDPRAPQRRAGGAEPAGHVRDHGLPRRARRAGSPARTPATTPPCWWAGEARRVRCSPRPEPCSASSRARSTRARRWSWPRGTASSSTRTA